MYLYLQELHVRHNLDVMHVEKNFTEILFGTVLNVNHKSNKDGVAARQDLKRMKIKRNLWPEDRNGKQILPNAPFTLSTPVKRLIFQSFSKLKVPVGYSGNWKHKVDLQLLQFKKMKSHDWHILMQGLLPVVLKYAFKDVKPLRAAILNVSLFFKILCSKVVVRSELISIHQRLVEALCVFEIYFPPSFFVSMVHVVVHLAEEVLLCGPVRFRWMYPFER